VLSHLSKLTVASSLRLGVRILLSWSVLITPNEEGPIALSGVSPLGGMYAMNGPTAEPQESGIRAFFSKIRKVGIAGFFFLLPVFVILIVISKAWTRLTSVGAKIAAIFGVKSIVGVGAHTIIGAILLIVLCLACGWLVRFSAVGALGNAVERALAKYIPGYDTYKALAEEKLQNKVKVLPYASALIKDHEYWRPAYIIEGDLNGNYVVFLPGAPETDKGHVLLAKPDQVRVLSSVTANQLQASLRAMGKGLLTEYHID